jgi:hypothetical protein
MNDNIDLIEWERKHPFVVEILKRLNYLHNIHTFPNDPTIPIWEKLMLNFIEKYNRLAQLKSEIHSSAFKAELIHQYNEAYYEFHTVHNKLYDRIYKGPNNMESLEELIFLDSSVIFYENAIKGDIDFVFSKTKSTYEKHEINRKAVRVFAVIYVLSKLGYVEEISFEGSDISKKESFAKAAIKTKELTGIFWEKEETFFEYTKPAKRKVVFETGNFRDKHKPIVEIFLCEKYPDKVLEIQAFLTELNSGK